MSTAPSVKTRRAARKSDGVDICCIFFCLGAADTLLGDRLGLEQRLPEGLCRCCGSAAAHDRLYGAGTVAGDPSGFVQRLLTAPLARLAARLQLEPASITGLVVTTANCIPTLLSLDTLEERGITLNTAYAVVAAYSVGDFLAFTPAIQPCTRTADDGRSPFKRLAGSGALPENNSQNHLSPPNGFSIQEMYGSRHTMRIREVPVNTIL